MGKGTDLQESALSEGEIVNARLRVLVHWAFREK